jgi:hypothetical protein
VAPATSTFAHEHRSAGRVEIGLGKSERFADPKPGSPQDHSQCSQASAVGTIAGGAHDGDDLLDGRRVPPESALFRGWVPGRWPGIVASERR